MLGAQSIFGTLWWVLIMFVYVRNTVLDGQLEFISGDWALPVAWWWERIGEANGTSTFLAVSLMLQWIFYAVVSVVEFVAWIMYLY